MARKSLEVRLSQTRSLMEQFDAACLKSDRSYLFMADMACRMERGKGMSKGQRKYLDDLIEQGVPTPKNEERVNAILAAAKVDGMQQVSSTLSDFAFKLGKGWALSEKQEKFLSSLLTKAETLRTEGRFRPSGALLEDLNNAVAICKAKNGWYWQHRPGTAKAFGKVESWLDWNARREVIKDVESLGKESAHILGEEPIIDQWACDKLLKAVKNSLNELKNPKHPEGSIAWKVMYNAPKAMALVAGAPTVNGGKIMYPCLINGVLVSVPSGDLKKRRG